MSFNVYLGNKMGFLFLPKIPSRCSPVSRGFGRAAVETALLRARVPICRKALLRGRVFGARPKNRPTLAPKPLAPLEALDPRALASFHEQIDRAVKEKRHVDRLLMKTR